MSVLCAPRRIAESGWWPEPAVFLAVLGGFVAVGLGVSVFVGIVIYEFQDPGEVVLRAAAPRHALVRVLPARGHHQPESSSRA
jgi:hypothetical protein